MPVAEGPLHGLYVIQQPTHADDRGFFREAFRLNLLEEALGRPVQWVQLNHARSRRHVIRGLHAENWDKLIYVPHGEVFTALADLRETSPTFGRIATFRLGEGDRLTLFVPCGLAHGYCVLSDEADYVYQASAYYDGSDTCAVAWDDPDLAIPWPVQDPVVSERDRANPRFHDLFPLASLRG